MRIYIRQNKLSDASLTYDVILNNADSDAKAHVEGIVFHAESVTAAMAFADELANSVNEHTLDTITTIHHDY